MKIIIIGALAESLMNFRGKLIQKFVESNHDVVALANNASPAQIERIQSLGARYIDYNISRNGLDPTADFKTFLELKKIFKSEKPDLVLSYTIKPVIWGGLAARFAKVPKFYALVTGLGYAFQPGGIAKTILISMVKKLYRFSLAKAQKVIFQNQDNLNLFVDLKLAKKEQCQLVNGSGVDLSHFTPAPLPVENTFLLVARLLGAKGIREYIEAANLVQQKHPKAQFLLVGPTDPSPDGIKLSQIEDAHQRQTIQYLGESQDVREQMKQCRIFVLPSYHEGLPRTVIEAMAMQRPVLTTDVPGCKATVQEGVNGWKVPKQDVKQLAERMIWFIENPQETKSMSQESLRIAHEVYDVHKVNQAMFNIMELD